MYIGLKYVPYTLLYIYKCYICTNEQRIHWISFPYNDNNNTNKMESHCRQEPFLFVLQFLKGRKINYTPKQRARVCTYIYAYVQI